MWITVGSLFEYFALEMSLYFYYLMHFSALVVT
jgi:hypothetical protein